MFGLLHRVEQGAMTGVIHVRTGGRDLGRLMVASGRICVAFGCSHHQDCGIAEEAALTSVVRVAQSRGLTLRQAALGSTARDVELVRAGLRRLTVASLRWMAEALVSGGQEPELDICPVRDDYEPTLTFSALDVFFGCTVDPDATVPNREHAEIVFAAFASSGQTGLFARKDPEPDAPPYLTSGYRTDGMTLREAILLARCGAELSRPWPMPDGAPGVPPACVTFRSGSEPWVCVPGRSGIALLRPETPAKSEALISWATSRCRSMET